MASTLSSVEYQNVARFSSKRQSLVTREYTAITVQELQDLLQARGLERTGYKALLIGRLKAFDACKASEARKVVAQRERPFPFFSLPPEIRNMVYEILAVDSCADPPIVRWNRLHRFGKFRSKSGGPQVSLPNLSSSPATYNIAAVHQPAYLEANSQLRREALGLWYRN